MSSFKVGDKVLVNYYIGNGRYSYKPATVVEINWNDSYPICVEYEGSDSRNFWKAEYVIPEALFNSPLWRALV